MRDNAVAIDDDGLRNRIRFRLLGDFAFTVPAGLTADALTRAVKGADKAAITGARVFDLFERDGVTSMAVEVTLQPSDKSFTDADLKAIADAVVAAAAKLGASLRG